MYEWMDGGYKFAAPFKYLVYLHCHQLVLMCGHWCTNSGPIVRLPAIVDSKSFDVFGLRYYLWVLRQKDREGIPV